MKSIIDLLARAMLAFIFLFEAYDSFSFFHETEEKMDLYGLTWNKEWVLIAAISILILGGFLLLIGYRVKFAVFLLLCYWIPVTFIMHGFWNTPPDCELTSSCVEGVQMYRRWQSIMFMKNIAIIGGLLMVYVNGSGKYSVKRLFATTKV